VSEQLGNPIQHQVFLVYTEPSRLHEELDKELHSGCTEDNCEVLREYRKALRSLGHDHPKSDCPRCSPAYAEPQPRGFSA
jgi:hypothetical protein